MTSLRTGTISALPLVLKPISITKPTLPPKLAHGLDEVLFKSGPVWLRDPANGKWNFPNYLSDLHDPSKFNFKKLPPYVTASRDAKLIDIARKSDVQFASSTSSFTNLLTKLYMLITRERGVQLGRFSDIFQRTKNNKFGYFSRGPTKGRLRYLNGIYAIDRKIPGDQEVGNVLMDYGRTLEKQLTVDSEVFKKYLLKPDETSSDGEQDNAESFNYTVVDNFVLRAQLDAFDERLPRKIFDIKTRATHPIRHDVYNFSKHTGYQIKTEMGLFESFEREYYGISVIDVLDMLLSAFIKYNLQVKIGQMDGIFITYHNTLRIFGFEYVPEEQMDDDIYGNSHFAEQSFNICIKLLNNLLQVIIKDYPCQDVQLFLLGSPREEMVIYAGQNLNDHSTVSEYCLQVHSKLNGEAHFMKDNLNDIAKSIQNDKSHWELEYEIKSNPLGVKRYLKELELQKKLSIAPLRKPYSDNLKIQLGY